MSFAGAYLQKAGLRGGLIRKDPDSGLHIIICIPVHRESGLERCLDSLFMCRGKLRYEVLILINARTDAPSDTLEKNLETLQETEEWIREHPHEFIDFHVLLDHSFEGKHAGVGLARKLLMDEAVRRFDRISKPEGIIASLDADALVDPDYLESLQSHFRDPSVEGCSVYFEHPLNDRDNPFRDEFPESVQKQKIQRIYSAITLYELHMRYYLQAVRSTGYPHAFHTLGSAFALRAEVYCQEGGMNRRQGGEDFYFIQKIAQRGQWSDCNATRVVPSPRPSDRVPFGTGPVVTRLTSNEGASKELPTYHPDSFRILRDWFNGLDHFFRGDPGNPDPVLASFLDEQDFQAALAEIRTNSASLPAFRKRFWRWFNMFRIMKFLHHARKHGYPDMPVVDAARKFTGEEEPDAGKLLLMLRVIDLNSPQQ